MTRIGKAWSEGSRTHRESRTARRDARIARVFGSIGTIRYPDAHR